MTGHRARTIGSHTVLLAFSLLAIFPIVLMWLTAFKSNAELATNPFGLPQEWRFENFSEAWEQGKFSSYFTSSVIVVIPVVAFSLVFSTLAGYAFAMFRFRGRGLLFATFLVGIMIPTEGFVIPLFYAMSDLGLLNSYPALILPQIALSTSFGMFWMRAFFESVPGELHDAAAVDGCGPMRSLYHVLLPTARPALSTLAVLLFMWTWNEFLLALVLVTDESVRTLPVALSFFQGQHTAQIPLLAAAATVVSLPILVVYGFLHRNFIEGMTAGASKL